MKDRVVYLDWNIYVDISQGRYSDLVSRLKNLNYIVPFSDEHIIEAFEGNKYSRSSSEISRQEKLEDISNISHNYYFEKTDNNNARLVEINPQEVSDTKLFLLRGIYNGIRGGINTEEFDQEWKKFLHEKLTSRHLNNLKYSKVIDCIEGLLNEETVQVYFSTVGISVSTFDDLVLHTFNIAENFFPSSDLINDNSVVFPTAFILLDILGYNSEKRTKERYMSLYTDAVHAYNATFAKFLITNDKKMQNKAKVLYDYYEFSTQVLNGDEAIEII